ncbi:MAG: thiolase family protein [Deltaproteobacteria bacterium]|nr:thiolase family protein [Deltaproteobacteria bacterium]MBW2301410.1 thiolase family protein [Deltaproteobacteria bacterium]
MKEIVIVSGVRTPVGRANRGTLARTRPDDLAAIVTKEVLERTPGVVASEVDDVIMGCAFPEHSQSFNIGRVAALLAGLPYSVPGQTVNRLCASGLQAIVTGAQQIINGISEIVIAGGVESMSQVPMMGYQVSLNLRMVENYPQAYISMGLTAENVAEKFRISRQDQDAFGFRSHQRAIRAIESGFFKDEITPVKVTNTYVNDKGVLERTEKMFDTDEGPRRTTLAKMSQLKPVFKKNGTVTAGNSSQMSDGAAAVMLMSADKAREKGLTPWLRFVGFAVAGVPPELMGIGPMYAVPKVMKQTGLKINDMDLIELNEAFASQAIACIRNLELDEEKTNVNGGAVALGHPLGCTGAKLTVQLMYEMKRRKSKYGLVTMCIGGGQGAAGIFENLLRH